ncbi:organic solute transporter subunit alpha [Marchantia polymorpha subsp. ruderalis]|nr:hypothetical protein MARPO_0177s0009 [Marchantia polymorpha]BBN02809.1 hypothetical protein Mp_2g18300 [Marchantia polymorpha subsp. ruderalis]|eukprot:PTQ27996.1 hypothetical protein MARPO_0177s0009 [Marchantia polymorpha]
MAAIFMEVLAGICAISAIVVALVHIFNHLRNYTEPTYQRYTVRIVFMVPVYAAMSFLSLLMPDKSIYFDSFRDIYEAWVIYNFMSLCLAWVGGPGAVVTSLAGRFLKPSWHLMTCCLPAIPLDGRFIRRCKQGCLQFVILKPLMVVATLWMYFKEKYSDGSFKASSGSLYVTLIYTASYTCALCALLLFYFACKELLRPFKPLPKFIIIKSVVFLTYWQGVLVGLMVSFGIIKNENDSADLQNFLICLEMLAAAIGHLYAFPYKEYAEANVGSSGGMLTSISHAINFNDVVYDTMHQFAPTYHNYVLYSDGSQEAPTKYRARTFIKTGQEMETLRINKNMGQSSKLDEGAYSSGLSSSEGGSPVKAEVINKSSAKGGETFKSSLLTEDEFSLAYDMSPLDAPSGHSKAAQSGPSASVGNFDPRNQIVMDFDPRKQSSIAEEVQQRQRPPGQNSSGLDSRRRSSTGEDAFEETRLTDRRKSSHGVLMEEIDFVGEEDAYHEGYVQH